MGISYNSEVCPRISSLMVQRTCPCLLTGNKQLYHKSHCKGMDFKTNEKKQSQSPCSVSFLLRHSPGYHKPQRSIGHGSEASGAARCLRGALSETVARSCEFPMSRVAVDLCVIGCCLSVLDCVSTPASYKGELYNSSDAHGPSPFLCFMYFPALNKIPQVISSTSGACYTQEYSLRHSKECGLPTTVSKK